MALIWLGVLLGTAIWASHIEAPADKREHFTPECSRYFSSLR